MRCSLPKLFFILAAVATSPLWASNSLIDVSENLDSPVTGVIYMLVIMSFIIAFGFAVATLFLWRRHRDNPVHVPLSQVFFSFIMAILAAMLPYFAAKTNGYDIFASDNYSAELILSSEKNTPVTQSDDIPPEESDDDQYSSTKKEKVPLWKEK